jgi:hypothetical protein
MKTIFIFLISILIFNAIKGQDLLVAQKAYIEKMAVDKEKNIILSGQFYGTRDFDFSLNVAELTSCYDGNGADLFIACYDSLLNYKWVINIVRCGGISMLTDDNGNIYITGNVYDSTDFDPSINTYYLPPFIDGYGYFLAKYDKDGIFKWVKKCESKLIAICNNSIFLDSFYGFKKYDLDGNEIWYKPLNQHLTPVFDNKSAFYFLSDTTNEYRYRPLNIFALDTSGNIFFNKNMTQSSNCMFETHNQGCLQIVNNKLIIQANYWGEVDLDPGESSNFITNNEYNKFVLKGYTYTVPKFKSFMVEYDIKGNFILGNEHPKLPTIYKSDESGNIYTVGSFSDSINLSYKKTENITISTLGFANYIAAYDSDFNFKSAVKLSEIEINQQSVYAPYINELYLRNNYTILVGRFYNLHLSQNTILYPNYPEFYIAIYKYFHISPLIIDSISGIGSSTISVYPNPVMNELWVEIPYQSVNNTIIIYDNVGQKVLEKQLKEFKNQIDMSNLKCGIYIIKLKTDKNEEIRKIIKE